MVSTLLLSRIQFGFTIGFHILFPTLNLGLALFLVIMEGFWLKTRNPNYLIICKFWSKIFALTFGMGVVSGIVLSYELGTNFGPFIAVAGSVLGPLFGHEVLSAFFLEAGFLGIMLFGWNKVSPKLHFAATLLVMLGTTLSAFWIMSANSWMQTPAGYHIAEGKYIVDSWLQVIFNPSFLPRFFHMLIASYVTSCFVIAGISAWYLLKQRDDETAKICFSLATGAALVFTVLQIFLGDITGVNIYRYQPLKTAAMEGLWETTQGAPVVLFALPKPAQEKNAYEFIKIPYLASLLNTHKLKGELLGLKAAPPEDRPLVTTVFFSFRIMVGSGFLLFFIACWGVWLRWRQQLYHQSLFLRACILVAPLGFVATIAGWLTSEAGRQPWIIYPLMRTGIGASDIPVSQVITSLALFAIVYGIVFCFYLYYLFGLIRKGPMVIKEVHAIDIEQPFHYMS